MPGATCHRAGAGRRASAGPARRAGRALAPWCAFDVDCGRPRLSGSRHPLARIAPERDIVAIARRRLGMNEDAYVEVDDACDPDTINAALLDAVRVEVGHGEI